MSGLWFSAIAVVSAGVGYVSGRRAGHDIAVAEALRPLRKMVRLIDLRHEQIAALQKELAEVSRAARGLTTDASSTIPPAQSSR